MFFFNSYLESSSHEENDKNWEVNGASSEHYTEANNNGLLHRMLGGTPAKKYAIFVRKS